MITARQLYDASTVTPADFGLVIDPDLDEDAKIEAAVAYIETNVLPGARAEVTIPFRKALGRFTQPLQPENILYLFGVNLTPEVTALWDAAEISFGRSEINKRIDTNSTAYDADSDQDRIQGNQRLQSLLAYAQAWREDQQKGTPRSGGRYGVSVSTAAHYDARNAHLVDVECANVAESVC